MGERASAHPDSLAAGLVAPCGMDCGVCIGHLRDRWPCPGCNDPDDSSKPHHCAVCSIRRCEHLPQGAEALCVDCDKYPCARLRQLDKRYRLKYRMSMIENLGELRRVGVEAFVELERANMGLPALRGARVCAQDGLPGLWRVRRGYSRRRRERKDDMSLTTWFAGCSIQARRSAPRSSSAARSACAPRTRSGPRRPRPRRSGMSSILRPRRAGSGTSGPCCPKRSEGSEVDDVQGARQGSGAVPGRE